MNSRLSHELHTMVDDVPTVDVIDRALGAVPGMRRRRAGAGLVGVAAVATALVTPFAFIGSGRPPVVAGALLTPGCGSVSPTSGAAALAPIGSIVLAHLPAGYSASGAWRGVFCQSPDRVPVHTYIISSSGGSQVTIVLVPRADRLPGMIFGGAPPFTATTCAEALDQAAGPAPSTSPSGVPVPSRSPSFTPSTSPSGDPVPSGSLSFTPSGSPAFSPSGAPSFSPSESMIVPPPGVPVGSPAAGPAPHVRFCHEPTATSPLVLGLAAGPAVVVVAVWADHRAIVARSEPAPVSSSTAPVTDDQLTALATDPALLAHVGD